MEKCGSEAGWSLRWVSVHPGSRSTLPTGLRTNSTNRGAPWLLVAQAAACYLLHTKAFILAHTMGSFSYIYFYLTFQSSVKSLWVKGQRHKFSQDGVVLRK